MAPTLHFSALFLSLLVILPTFHAWQFSTSNGVDLSSPPAIASGDAVVNGKPLANYSTGLTAWPCYNYPVPADVPRTPFPVTGGRLSFTLTNTSAGSLWNYQYIGDIYLGQISLGDGTYSTPSQDPGFEMNAGYTYVETDVWNDFSSGPDCSDTVDVVAAISTALGKFLTLEDVVGMNATFGMRIVLFGPNPLATYAIVDDDNVEEMYQCGYVTFTDEDLSSNPNAGYCNGGSSPTPSSTAAIPTTHASPPPHPVPSPGNSTVAAVPSSHTHTVAIGAGIGVSMGASLLILMIAFIFVRRRKARKHSETIGADVVVTRPRDVESMKGKIGKEMEMEEGIVSSGSSTHSEPLPPYTAEREMPHGH